MKIKELSPQNRQFVDSLFDALDAASWAGNAKANLRSLLASVQRRDVQHIACMPAEQVTLTDAQWAELEQQVRIAASMPGESW